MTRFKKQSTVLSVFTLLLSTLFQSQGTAAESPDPLFEGKTIFHLLITITPEDVASLESEPRKYVPVTILDGNKTYQQVALRLKGSKLGSFRPLNDKPALTLNFDKFVDGQRFYGLDKLYLNNSVEDPSYMTEYLCSAFYREAKMPAPRVTFARVTINGKSRGFYVLKEGYDKTFLKRWFEDNDGNFYDSESSHDVTYPLHIGSGDKKSDRSDLKSLVDASAIEDHDQRMQQLNTVLDLEHFIKFVSMEILTGHWDGYALNRNNYRIYNNPADSRFVFMPHGMDMMFQDVEEILEPEWVGVIAQSVMETSQGRKDYIEQLRNLQQTFLTAESLHQRIDEVQARIRPVLTMIHPKAATSHDRHVRLLKKRIEEHMELLTSELEEAQTP